MSEIQEVKEVEVKVEGVVEVNGTKACNVHLVSDSTGDTLLTMVSSITAQFPKVLVGAMHS